MIIESQRDPRWANHVLGWGPALGTIGQYGCYNTCFSMIAIDSKVAMLNPAQIDDAFTGAKLFTRDSTGTFDLLPDNALDQLFPGRFHTHSVGGFDGAGIAAAVVSPHTYAIGWIVNPAIGVPTHFVIFWSKDGKYIADPWTGKVGTLAGYGGPAAIHKTIYVDVLPVPAPAPTPPVTPVVPVTPPPVVTPPQPPQPVTPPAVVPPVVVTPLPVPTPVPDEVNAAGVLQNLLIYLIKTFIQLMGQSK